MKKEYGQLLTALLAIFFGLFGLITFIPDAGLAVGFISLTFGILAIIWAARARASLSPGTTLRDYTTYFLLSLIFVVLYSVWDTLVILVNGENIWVYPKYILVSISYLIFVFTSYKILYVGKMFGFKTQVNKMDLNNKDTEKKKVKKTKK